MKRQFLQTCAYALIVFAQGTPTGPRYLFVWAGDSANRTSDFLTVLDVTPGQPTYGRIVASVAAGAVGTTPHHTEYSLSASGFLFANGFESGKSFLFDVRDPLHPKVVRGFGDLQGFMSPHSFVRLPNGHALATFHMKHGDRGGGLVELDNDGNVVRTASAVDPKASDVLIRPYSLAVLPVLDRLLATSSPMHFLDGPGIAVQVWRLSDLKLLRTIRLSPGPRGMGTRTRRSLGC